MAKKLYPRLKKMVRDADDPLLMAVELSIVGNVIDFGTANRFNVKDMIDLAIRKEIGSAYPRFKDALRQSKTILYLADNAGEVFFDKLLLEELVKEKKEITYAVKANPIINDATIEDAKFAGIDNLATVITYDKGQKISAPGTVLSHASKDFFNTFENADMVIAKGQGNYESLSNIERDTFFLLMVKCPLVSKDIGIKVGNIALKVNE
jgi:hypothetical protein